MIRIIESPDNWNTSINEPRGKWKFTGTAEQIWTNQCSIKLIANRWAWELVPRKFGGEGPCTWGTAGRFPWQPCERQPSLPAATNQHRHTEETSVEILTSHCTYLRQTYNKGGRGRVVNCLRNTVDRPLWSQTYSRWRIRLIHQHMVRQTHVAIPHAYLVGRLLDT